MKLYQIGSTFVGTQAEAKAAAKELKIAYVEIDVPTDKPSLIGWLNAFATNNGLDDQFSPVLAERRGGLLRERLEPRTEDLFEGLLVAEP